jgi:hypothetical protein
VPRNNENKDAMANFLRSPGEIHGNINLNEAQKQPIQKHLFQKLAGGQAEHKREMMSGTGGIRAKINSKP